MTYQLESELVEDCRKAAVAMGLMFERIGQRDARKAGSDRGAPDVLLYGGGTVAPCEFKRVGGRFSLDQLVAAERRRACGVETYCPDTLEAFMALANWMRCGRTARPRCPVVPAP